MINELFYTTLNITIEQNVGMIEFNRPHKLNSFITQQYLDLASALLTLDGDARVRVLFLTGTGRFFSCGQDLKVIQSATEGTWDEVEAMNQRNVGL